MLAYDMGLKGITYMRDGSREGVLTRAEDVKPVAPVPQVQNFFAGLAKTNDG